MGNKLIAYIPVLIGCTMFTAQGIAQQTPPTAGYFQNQYLLNPAMSGTEAKSAHIGAGYGRQSNVQNAPVAVYLNGDYGFTENMGGGINVFTDKAGLLRMTKVMATFSYHVALGENKQQLHFGISAGGVQYRLNFSDVNGDLNDPSLYNYNSDNSMKFEMDAGVGYTDGRLNVQAAFPNLMSYARKETGNVANKSTFILAASYKLGGGKDNEGISVEPKVVYRGVKNNDAIIDAGANVGLLKDVINVFGLYHSTKNITAGVTLNILKTVEILAAYTTQTKELKSNNGAGLEFGLRCSFK